MLQDRFNKVAEILGEGLLERQAEISLVLLGLLSGEHVLLIGPPGTAKSMTLYAWLAFLDGRKFEYLMTRFMSPDEIFGAFAIKQLVDHGELIRRTQDKLPEAEYGFLDEVFRGSSPAMNMLLKVMNEGTFNDGTGWKKLPLRILVGATNGVPSGEEFQELGAFWDRFLLRRTVARVHHPSNWRKMVSAGPPHFDPEGSGVSKIKLAELDAAREQIKTLKIDERTLDCLERIRAELLTKGIAPSDRRWVKSMGVARANAWLNQHAAVQPEDLECLRDVLWEDPQEHPTIVAQTVLRLANPLRLEANQAMTEADQILDRIEVRRPEQVLAGAAKLEEVRDRLAKFRDEPCVKEARSYVDRRLSELRTRALATGTL